jgi:hypothetical protein
MYACGLFVHQKCSNYALTNLLFGLCIFIWIIDLLVICPSPHHEALARLSHPQMFQVKEHTPIPFSIVFIFEFVFEFFKEFGGASHLDKSCDWSILLEYERTDTCSDEI